MSRTLKAVFVCLLVAAVGLSCMTPLLMAAPQEVGNDQPQSTAKSCCCCTGGAHPTAAEGGCCCADSEKRGVGESGGKCGCRISSNQSIPDSMIPSGSGKSGKSFVVYHMASQSNRRMEIGDWADILIHRILVYYDTSQDHILPTRAPPVLA